MSMLEYCTLYRSVSKIEVGIGRSSSGADIAGEGRRGPEASYELNLVLCV